MEYEELAYKISMTENFFHHKFILLGASRGLGWATYKALQKKFSSGEFLLISRKILTRENEISASTRCLAYDFSTGIAPNEFIEQLLKFEPTALIYFAGGGPFGAYQDKKWSDHLWALNVNFLFPAQLLHSLMRGNAPSLKQVVCIGSKIAEDKSDPGAASYCAGKHALKGLISTLQRENKSPFEIKLFSPGYIQTDMLPPQSWPRKEGLAATAENVALELIDFLN